MKPIWLIAHGEWHYWLRSQLTLGGSLIFLVLIVITSLLSMLRIEAEAHTRTHQQAEAEETFLGQPGRHPHRMVHYGHYLFRTPAPLALFDPGLDAVTGQAIFLEGHRQNTVMFAESAASADFGGLCWLSPALVYQLFAPLLIILLGYGSMVRERETSVLAPLLALGISGRSLVLGKALALFFYVVILLIPLMASCMISLTRGEDLYAVISLFVVYLMYLTVWIGFTLLASTLLKQRSSVLATLAGLWFGLSLVLPSIAVNLASDSETVAGKIATDFAMLEDVRKLGDGHNANDPAFQKLRRDLLSKYNADSVEQLPVNIRGVVAMESEEKLTDVLNQYADARMTAEAEQAAYIANYAWFTPALAIAFVSRAIAGTDLSHYHHFQKQAESVRYAFVQGLNRVQAEKLSYQDDMNRNKDEASWERARVDASNWQVLDTFQFQTLSLSERISNAAVHIKILLAWLLVTYGLLIWSGNKVKP